MNDMCSDTPLNIPHPFLRKDGTIYRRGDTLGDEGATSRQIPICQDFESVALIARSLGDYALRLRFKNLSGTFKSVSFNLSETHRDPAKTIRNLMSHGFLLSARDAAVNYFFELMFLCATTAKVLSPEDGVAHV